MRAAGRAASDGREALLEQGAAAFELWFPGRPAPREVMRAALRAALG
jgi:shikimate 5-dehydrogenase